MVAVKADVITKAVELKNVDINLSGEDAYYLIGLLGATTDSKGSELYDALTSVVGEATGENPNTIYSVNEIAREAFDSARNGRFSGAPIVAEPKTVSFQYDGFNRTVKDPTIDGTLLKGFELTRGGKASEQFKSYRLDKIGKSLHSRVPGYPTNFLRR